MNNIPREIEFQNVDESDVISDADLIKQAVALQVTVEHVRYVLEEERVAMVQVTVRNFFSKCNRLEKATPDKPNNEQYTFLKKHFDARLAMLLNTILDKSQSITPINVIPMVIMANQRNICTTDFIGGTTPTYVVSTKKSIAQMPVISSLGYVSDSVISTLQEMGAERVRPATPTAMNFAVVAATMGEFVPENDNRWMPKKAVSDKVDLGKHFRAGVLATDGSAYMSSMLKWRTATQMEILNNLLSKSTSITSTMNKVAKPSNRGVPLKDMGGYIIEMNRQSIYAKNLNTLHTYDQLISNSIGKKKTFFKMSDTGAREVNASLKWSFALSFVSGTPFKQVNGKLVCVKGFEKKYSCGYFGAAGNRARQAFDNRFDVSAFDIKEPIVYNNKMTEDMLKEAKLANWTQQDVLVYLHHDQFDIFASDIYMKQWSDKGRDPRGHKFVSGILRGKLVDVDSELTTRLPSMRFVKGFIPQAEHIDYYAKCYPFVLFNVCRPMTTEVIYLKIDELKVQAYEQRVKDLSEAYGFEVGIPVPKRMQEGYKGPKIFVRWPEVTLVKDSEQFTEVCRQLMILRCQELNWLVRKLAVDCTDSVGSPHNRRIWLHHSDMPNLHVLKKFALSEVESVSMYSSAFSAMFGIDDIPVKGDQEESLEKDEPEEQFDGRVTEDSMVSMDLAMLSSDAVINLKD